MRIIDNINELLGDDLKAAIRPGSKLRVAASTFSIFAFEALKRELGSIKELEFIFTAPSFMTAQATDKPTPEKRQFFIPSDKDRDATLYGSEFEIRLRNKLTQRAIARECAEWVRQKVTFRSNHTGAPMQSFAIVDDTAAYAPLQGFTTADLGYERGPAVSNMVHKIDDAPLTQQYIRLFDQIWHNPKQLDDVTETVREHIASVYAENSPQRVYFLILFNLFSQFLDDVSEDVLPNDLTGYQDTVIWNGLYNFQKDAGVAASSLTPAAGGGNTGNRLSGTADGVAPLSRRAWECALFSTAPHASQWSSMVLGREPSLGCAQGAGGLREGCTRGRLVCFSNRGKPTKRRGGAGSEALIAQARSSHVCLYRRETFAG